MDPNKDRVLMTWEKEGNHRHDHKIIPFIINPDIDCSICGVGITEKFGCEQAAQIHRQSNLLKSLNIHDNAPALAKQMLKDIIGREPNATDMRIFYWGITYYKMIAPPELPNLGGMRDIRDLLGDKES